MPCLVEQRDKAVAALGRRLLLDPVGGRPHRGEALLECHGGGAVAIACFLGRTTAGREPIGLAGGRPGC